MKNIVEFTQRQIIGAEQVRPQITSIDAHAENCMNAVIKELRSIFPAWRNAIKTKQELDDVKRTWAKAFMENGIVSMAVVEKGLSAARESKTDFFPSVGKFISWCHDDDFHDCFDRFMANEKPRNQFERLVFGDAMHVNVKRKPIGEDERTFKRCFDKWVKRFSSGDIPQDAPALSPKSVVMPTDIARERAGKPSPDQFRKGSVFNRIAHLAEGV